MERLGSAGLGGAEQLFQLGPGLLDRIQVRRIRRQVEQFSSRSLDQLLDPGHLVGAEVVHYDYIAGPQLRTQHLFEIGQKDVAIGGLLDGHGRQQAAEAQGAEDGEDLPMASRSGFMHAPPAAGAGITACHLRGHSALVEEDQLLRRDGLEALEELFPPLAVLFAVAFDGVKRLFFSRRPICRRTCHRRPTLTCRWTAGSSCCVKTPTEGGRDRPATLTCRWTACSSFCCNSARVRSGCASIQPPNRCSTSGVTLRRDPRRCSIRSICPLCLRCAEIFHAHGKLTEKRVAS